MSKQDRQPARTTAQLEQKYDWGKTFAQVFGLIDDAQKSADDAMKAVEGLDKELDHEEIFNRLTNYGKVQGIYRSENDDIYINASYIKSGTLSADRIDAANLKVTAANITGSLTANQFTMGGQMAVYQEVGGTNLGGYFGYMDVSSGSGFSGKAIGIAGPNTGGHVVMLAPLGNIAISGYADVYISSSFYVKVNGIDMRIKGKAVLERLNAFEAAFNVLGMNFTWQNDGEA